MLFRLLSALAIGKLKSLLHQMYNFQFIQALLIVDDPLKTATTHLGVSRNYPSAVILQISTTVSTAACISCTDVHSCLE